MGDKLKRIVVVADTHLPKFGKEFPLVLINELKKADCIIHAGDLSTVDVYDQLSEYAFVYAVYGNVDDEKVLNKLDDQLVIQIEDVKIGITHGHGEGKTTLKRVIDRFKDDDVDLVIFGHSHIPLLQEINGRWYFNPGSPTNKRKQKDYSFGLLMINEQEFLCKHIYFSSKD